MKRTKKKTFKRADLILCADIHLMENKPVCRTDDFVTETQWKKMNWLCELQNTHDCQVMHAGDLFHYWKPSPWLLSKALNYLPMNMMSCYGNHDLPQHNYELKEKSGLYVLEQAGAIQIDGGHWGADGPGIVDIIDERRIGMVHIMTYQGKEPYPGCTAPKGATLLRQYPEYDLIVTGDNHKPFVEEHEGRLLVNPGSLFRTTAAQFDYKPRVYLWYAETNTVEAVYVPIEEGVISREHIEKVGERNDRIDAFINTLNDDWEAKMSFEENIERFKEENNVSDKVMKIIYKAIDNGTN